MPSELNVVINDDELCIADLWSEIIVQEGVDSTFNWNILVETYGNFELAKELPVRSATDLSEHTRNMLSSMKEELELLRLYRLLNIVLGKGNKATLQVIPSTIERQGCAVVHGHLNVPCRSLSEIETAMSLSMSTILDEHSMSNLFDNSSKVF
jgi:hypothetical protein